MATVPTVKTWAAGDDATAAVLNSGVKNPIQWLLNGFPYADLRQSVTQAVFAASTWTDITFTTEDADTDAQHSTSSNTARIVIGGTLGYYLVFGTIAWPNDSTGVTRRARIAKNGVAVTGSHGRLPAGEVSVSTPARIIRSTAAADYITLQGYHDASSSIAPQVSSDFTSTLTAFFLRTP